jgi:hypothetical protein
MWAKRSWLLPPFLALPVLLTLFTTRLTASADGATHLMRTALLVNHWQNSVLYPRWIPELVTGLGYPLLNFYAPSAYYLTGAIQLTGATLSAATLLTFAFFIVAGGLGMVCWARDLFDADRPWPALLAGVAYMYAPYLLANVFVRGAIAEVGAQALLPWILWSGRRLITRQRALIWLAPFALTLGALAVTHTVTLIIFPPFLLGYLVALWWQRGHQWPQLGWMAAGIGAGVGISAFFWIPLIGDSGYLSQDAFNTSIEIFIPENLWRWQNFLDIHLPYEYTFAVPYQLGLGQIILGVAGIFFVRHWNLEWRYLLLATLGAALLMGSWAESIWISNRLLLAVQFPWRLLTILSVTLPLFTGALVWRISQPRRQALAASGIILFVIVANWPQIGWMNKLETENGGMPLPAIARHESITGQLGTGPTREFMPKWSNDNATYQPAPSDTAIIDAVINLRRADGYGLELDIASSSGGPLRFTNFYFPGWQALLDPGVTLAPYRTTNLGLLTVDLPPGNVSLRLINVGADLQRWATWLTLLTLSSLIVVMWRARVYWWVSVFTLLLLVGSGALLQTPQPALVQQPAQPLQTDNLTLLGYRIQQARDARLLIYPFWYVHNSPAADLRVTWQLRDDGGDVINLTSTRPYFNSQRASNWPPGALVDDAYELTPPPGMPAGTYQLTAQLVSSADQLTTLPTVIATLDLPAQPDNQPEAPNPLSLHFGDAIRLVGYETLLPQQASRSADTAVVHPGDTMEFTLFWAADAPPDEDYHGFIHLVDLNGNAVEQSDQLVGSIFRPPMTWDTAHILPDPYTLHVPADASNGLLWPTIGLYAFETQQRLSIANEAGQPIGNAFQLPPVKIYGANPAASPQQRLDVTLGEKIALLGYDLALPDEALRPGSQFTLTLYYQAKGAIDAELTQFVHLFDPALGMAAQQDSPPQRGANPTNTWQPGEIIIDQIMLQVSPNASPGFYTLGAGMYNSLDGNRVSATNADGDILPDAVATFRQLKIEPVEK